MTTEVNLKHWGYFTATTENFLRVMLDDKSAYLLKLELVMAFYREALIDFREMMTWIGWVSDEYKNHGEGETE